MASHKEAALAGIRDHGLKWKHRLRAARHIKTISEIINKEDFTESEYNPLQMAMIAFATSFEEFAKRKGIELDYSAEEAIEWLKEEPVSAENLEFFDGTTGFIEELRHRLNEIYDFADYHRILICE